jgi:hypothetical protein
MAVEFHIFGKAGCSLCDNRKSVIEGVIKRSEAEAEIVVFDVDDPVGMVEMSMLDDSKGEIPIVCAYVDDELVHMWDGPTAPVKSKEVREILQ